MEGEGNGEGEGGRNIVAFLSVFRGKEIGVGEDKEGWIREGRGI